MDKPKLTSHVVVKVERYGVVCDHHEQEFDDGGRIDEFYSVDGMKIGRGTQKFADGSFYSGNYVTNVLQGPALFFSHKGCTRYMWYEDGVRTGASYEVWEDGQVWESEYVCNVRTNPKKWKKVITNEERDEVFSNWLDAIPPMRKMVDYSVRELRNRKGKESFASYMQNASKHEKVVIDAVVNENLDKIIGEQLKLKNNLVGSLSPGTIDMMKKHFLGEKIKKEESYETISRQELLNAMNKDYDKSMRSMAGMCSLNPEDMEKGTDDMLDLDFEDQIKKSLGLKDVVATIDQWKKLVKDFKPSMVWKTVTKTAEEIKAMGSRNYAVWAAVHCKKMIKHISEHQDFRKNVIKIYDLGPDDLTFVKVQFYEKMYNAFDSMLTHVYVSYPREFMKGPIFEIGGDYISLNIDEVD